MQIGILLFACPFLFAFAMEISAASTAALSVPATTATGLEPIYEQHPIERGELHPLRDVCDLTASDVPTLFGFGYETLQQLVDRKRNGGHTRQVSQFVKELCERGHALEAPSCAWLDKKLKLEHRVADFFTLKMDVDGVPALFGASPDAIYVAEDNPTMIINEEDDLLVEIKNPLNSTDVAPDQSEPRSKEKWWQYWLQVQFQLAVSHKSRAILCVWHPVLPPRVFRIRFVSEWWDQAFLPAFRRFRRYLRPGLGAEKVPRWTPGYREEVYAWEAHL